MSIKINVKVSLDAEELEIEHTPETCTEADIDAMCFAIRRYLREVYGRSPMNRPLR